MEKYYIRGNETCLIADSKETPFSFSCYNRCLLNRLADRQAFRLSFARFRNTEMNGSK